MTDDRYELQVARSIALVDQQKRDIGRREGHWSRYAFMVSRLAFPGPWVDPEARLDDMKRTAKKAIAAKVRLTSPYRRPERPERVVAHIVTPSDPDFATGRLLGPDGQSIGGS